MLNLKFSEQQLCMDLLQADTEAQVISILRSEGYWDNPKVWRTFGDKEDNFSIIGNQARRSDAALVEKLVNSVDAVLMGECWSQGMCPNAQEAPKSIPEAVAKFFFGETSRTNTLGDVSRWSDKKRRELSNLITLAATGSRSNPSLTVVDAGEGQTPESIPNTLLSLDKRNKVDVHFVQGKFNMGGTGALRFCGEHNLQLVISRRNPNIKLDEPTNESSGQWGFTIVRRDNPTPAKRLSTYTYLAPHKNGVLRFDADSMPLFPLRNEAYARSAKWGTAIKLYEYSLRGKSHILLPDGLLNRLDILLPGIALPVRLHECRDFGGRSGSFDTTLSGLGVRLREGRSNNLEPGFPTGSVISISGQQMIVEVYAFKRGKAGTYRKNEGIIFTVNGQTHGSIPKRFFGNRAVGLNRLEESLLVIVDCSQISGRHREDLFMNSRDQMEQGEFLRAIRDELQSILKRNTLLRELRVRRRSEDVASKLQDSKPFKDVLESILSKSPTIAALFSGIGPLSDPFKSKKVKSGNGFHGKPHPSIFRFRDKDYGHVLQRTSPINMRSRLVFETDVVNDYFSREQFAGKYILRSHDSLFQDNLPSDYNLNLQNGVATLNLELPKTKNIGDSFKYELIVQDETLLDPFVNQFKITVGQSQKPSGGNTITKPPSNQGNNGGGERPQGLAIPTPIPVYESDWELQGFDKYSALKAIHDTSDDELSGFHDYYVNMDNIYLNTELKATKENPEIVKARWQYGMVLIGMALLRHDKDAEVLSDSDHELEGDNALSPENEVYKVTKAIAPMLLPMIEHLGVLSDEDLAR